MSLTIRSLREEKHLSQEQLALKFHLPLSTIQALERDSSQISDLILDKYLLYFHISYDEIFIGSTAERQNKTNTKS